MNKKKVKFNIDLFSSPSVVSSVDTPKNEEKEEICDVNEYGTINLNTAKESFTTQVKKVTLTTKKAPSKKLLFSCPNISPVKKSKEVEGK